MFHDIKRKDIKNILKKPETNFLIILFILGIILTIASPYFFTSRNILNVLRQSSLIAILALGEAMVIIVGGIDLSLGSLVGLTACLGARVAKSGASPLITLITIFRAGGGVGMLNGFMVTKIKLPSFIATLGMMSIVR